MMPSQDSGLCAPVVFADGTIFSPIAIQINRQHSMVIHPSSDWDQVA